MKTTIDYGDGASLELDISDADRSYRDAALETKRQFACRDCGHHANAHRTGNCSTLMVPPDRAPTIANAKKCGCAAMKQKVTTKGKRAA